MSMLSLAPFALKDPLYWNMPTERIADSLTPPDVASDTENVRLMLRVKEGDILAFEKLVETHQRMVIGTVTRMLGNVDDAHDVAQQVFVRIWRSAARYEPSAKFTTWLYTIMKNLVFNELRRRGRKREISMDEREEQQHLEPAAPHRLNPDTVVQQDELENAMDAAIQALPEKQRLAVLLRRHDDMPYEQICDILDMSLPAVKSLLFRARNDLKAKLSAYLGDA